MSVDETLFKQALACFATGVTIVTTTDSSGERRGLTANALTSVSLNPPLVLFALDRSSSNLTAFEESSNFAINILKEEHRELAEHFARSIDNKFTQGNWGTGKTGIPVLTDALVSIECSKWRTYDGGDHILLLGKVEALTINEGTPLLYYRSKLWNWPGAV